ncbi:MAG: magnesium and cobalt transport protein CorA [Anaerolineaceae bacterium]|nr:MAG: magnesium and cobalt transport protein CorA [Anaerolineaceae bacterium]
MIRSIYYQTGKPLQTDLEPASLQKALRSRRGVLWVDFVGEPPETCQPIFESFGFHPLAIDDALQETHSPKIDDWGNYIYLVLNYMHLNGREKDHWETEIDELDIFLGPNYVVTHHDLPVPAIDTVLTSIQRDQRVLHDGADHLLYKIMDNVVTNYMPIVERIDEEIDEIEDQVFDRPTPRTLERLFALKRVLLAMRRILLPQREVLNKLARDDYAVIDQKDRIFFRDIYDHLVRLHDLNETMRDLVGGALDTYLSVINNRMNEAMKTLAIITTLFMPLSFIAGVFGMNFFLPRPDDAIWELMQRPVFYAVILAMIVTPILMYQWMRKRTWV